MTLDIDIGNTRLKWRCGELRGFVSTSGLDLQALGQAWGGLDTPAAVRVVSVACHEAEAVLAQYCQQQWSLSLCKAETQASQAGVINSYQDHTTMGADRWLAMLAGFNRQPGGCCVVDCGSAVTIDYVDADGQHLGGYIAPGLRLMRKGLLGNTRQIHLPIESSERWDTRPGRSTAEAVGHGIELMLAALAERVVRDAERLLGSRAALLVTGGDGAAFIESAGKGEYCPDLVLDGLDWALPEVLGSNEEERF
ncbi:type III pantothenate kinase [Motiliproteus coralliicola]|uniref:Type III pantothenate kinase n=1 Tax=Motiliproteus coralliicola TaxID=2283196 RepID=A0A369WA31_9GAMM|nr:type III pantothenate kinase [Motiliproteus coralliicola]RDE18163.1 type III pantothenate kinase [Motiliproteus coralliicola]